MGHKSGGRVPDVTRTKRGAAGVMNEGLLASGGRVGTVDDRTALADTVEARTDGVVLDARTLEVGIAGGARTGVGSVLIVRILIAGRGSGGGEGDLVLDRDLATLLLRHLARDRSRCGVWARVGDVFEVGRWGEENPKGKSKPEEL